MIKYIVPAAILIGIIAMTMFFKPDPPEDTSLLQQRPEVLNVQTHQVTIAWISRDKYKGKVKYRPAGSNSPLLSKEESHAGTNRHEVLITGLQPSTRYAYQVDDTSRHYQFQTQPLSNSPFSFLLVYGNVSDRIVELMMTELPEFILSLSTIPENIQNGYTEVRPFIPVYGPSGIDSPYMKSMDIDSESGPDELWKIDWGGLRLIFMHQHNLDPGIFNAPSVHTFGIITDNTVIDLFESEKNHELSRFSDNQLHLRIMDHNRKHPGSPVAFVGVRGESDRIIERDGIKYFGIPVLQTKGSGTENKGSIRIDVDVDSTRAFFIESETEIVLRSPPLKQEITCGECRRLADKGAYEESVKAYESFIEHNKGHYQIDDACYAIAEILDEKLFRFQEALKWYERLTADYPESTLTPLARQRIRYLSKYSDYDFKPLRQFDRIRKIELSRKKHSEKDRKKLLDAVESIIKAYPESNLAPVMQYWLANQYRNSNPDRAVDAYLRLRKLWPDYPDAKEVLIEIGETYYQAGRYLEALETYEKALAALPGFENTIKAQIKRCLRNINREKIHITCWAIAIVLGILTLVFGKSALSKKMVIISIIAVAFLGSILMLGAWLIHEQFSSFSEMTWMIGAFTVITILSAVISISFSEGFACVFAKQGGLMKIFLMALAGFLPGSAFFFAGLYLAIYYINVHYLIIINL
jgi:tetratricopeptide (TPR) repeat protein